MSTVLEEDEGEEDDTENDVSYGQQSQTSSANNSILSTPTRTNRHKVPLHQEQTVDVHDGCNYHENCSTAISPPPLRVMSPTSVSSPSSSAALDYGNDEPLSLVEWNCNQDEHDVIPNHERHLLQARSPLHYYDDDYEPPPPPPLFAPSFFTTTTPWMCVFDLDAACGGGGDSSNPILATTEPHQGSSSVASPKSAPQQQHEHWNDLLPTVMDFSQWFTHGNSYNSTTDCRSTIQAQSPGSPTEFDHDEYEYDHDDPKLLSPLIQLPLSPTSVRQPLFTITTTTTDDYPLISKQLFTNYATNCDIETIYFTPPPPPPQSMVCFYNNGYWYYYQNRRTFFVLVYRRALDDHYLSPMFFRSENFGWLRDTNRFFLSHLM